MTTDSSTTTGRTAELEFEINAPVDQVWSAISEAEHLANWFPLTCEVTPGEGGSMFMTWGDAFKGNCTIEVWEPNKHLRTTFMEDSKGEPMRTFVDYYLEGQGGVTKLRLVHSGFGEGSAWDAMYDAVSNGWAAELRSLCHYMANHFGAKRDVAWTVLPLKDNEAESWETLMSDRCIGIESSSSLRAGDRFRANGPALGQVNGTVLHTKKPGVLVGTIDELNDAFFRVELERCSGPEPSVWFWVSAYGVPQADVEALRSRINSTLGALFG